MNPKTTRSLPEGFNTAIYLELNPDVAAAGVDPIQHWFDYGAKEGRQYMLDNTRAFTEHLAYYSSAVPSAQNSFDMFKNTWSTKMPGIETHGVGELMNDARIHWLTANVCVDNLHILELGPLEGAHTFMLEKAGGNVSAIEGNYGAFLRCLVVKNHFDLKAKFMLGDFSLCEFRQNAYDLIVASGVLYHMKDPIALLRKISVASGKLFLWTHYFEPDLSKWNANLGKHLESGKWDKSNIIEEKVNNSRIRMVRQEYREALRWSGFCGGPDKYSHWIFKEDIITLLREVGYDNILVNFDTPAHPNGPSFAIIAEK